MKEGKLLGSEDLLGIKEGKALGSEDLVGIEEGKSLGFEDSDGFSDGRYDGYKSCRSMIACTSPSAKGVTWGAVGSLDHFLLGFVTFRYAS